MGLPEGAPAQRPCQPPIPKVSVVVFRKPAQALRSPHHHYHNRNNGPSWLRDLSVQELTEKHSVLVRASQLSSADGKGHLISQVGNANTLDNTQPKRPNSPRHELRLSSLFPAVLPAAATAHHTRGGQPTTQQGRNIILESLHLSCRTEVSGPKENPTCN